MDIFLEKTGQIEPFAGNEATEWGKILEPEILKRYQKRTQKPVYAPDKTYRHKDRSWQLATPDALVVEEKRIVEAKDVGQRMASGWGEEGGDAVPEYYLVQILHQMDTLDYDVADVAALIDRRLRIYTVPRDKELCDIIEEKVERFWFDHVVKGEPPPITPSDRTREWLRKRFAKNVELLRPATTEEGLMMDMLKAAREKIDEYKNVKETLELRLQAAIGDAEGVAGDGFKVTWKLDSGKKSYTVKEQPPKRVFRPTWSE